MPTLKNMTYSILFFIAVIIGLSLFADIAYVYTLCGLAGLIAFGHLITLDDDMPGEWSNPEKSKALWHMSLAILAAKFLVFMGILVLILSFPAIARYGA